MQSACLRQSRARRRFARLVKIAALFAATIIPYAAITVAAEETAVMAEKTVIHAGHLLAVPGEPMLENVSIIIENGTIKSIRKGFEKAGTVIDLSDSYVLPGLIDMHTHVTYSAAGETDPGLALLKVVTSEKSALALKAIPYIRQTLRAGFTTIRNLGDPGGVILDLRDAINRGLIDGPRILAAVTQLSVSGGEYDPARLRVTPQTRALFDTGGICDGPYECRRAVRKLVAGGADVIKLRIAGNGAILGHSNVYEREDEIRAIIDTAHSLGKKVAVHVASEKAAMLVVKAGADTIEHGPLPKEAFALMKNAYFTPTLYVNKKNRELVMRYSGRDMFAESLERTRDAYKSGIRILFGSDSGAIPHSEAVREFGVLVEAGLSPVDAIKSATVTAAQALGLEHMIGTLEEGKAADIIAVSDNPLKNITSLEQVRFVMKGGKVVHFPKRH